MANQLGYLPSKNVTLPSGTLLVQGQWGRGKIPNVEKRKKILEVFSAHNTQMKALQGVDFAASTMQRYNISYNHTRDFIKWKYGADDRDIKDLDHEFISQYAFWLKTVRNCDHNTTMKYLVNFKKNSSNLCEEQMASGRSIFQFQINEKACGENRTDGHRTATDNRKGF